VYRKKQQQAQRTIIRNKESPRSQQIHSFGIIITTSFLPSNQSLLFLSCFLLPRFSIPPIAPALVLPHFLLLSNRKPPSLSLSTDPYRSSLKAFGGCFVKE
jgi:hypothetical protein